MLAFVWRRVIQLIAVLFAVSSVLFFLLRLSGDPVVMLVGDNASPETVARVRHDMGFDDPLPTQYIRFLGGVATLRFGDSIQTRQDALGLVLERLPRTALLAATSMLLALVAGIPAGVYAGTRDSRLGGALVQGCAFVAQSMPSFWLGIVLILVFSVRLRWLPSFGTGSARNLVLPAITLGALPLAKIILLMRSAMLEVRGADYVRTAQAKGLSVRAQIWRHAVPNALIPVVSVVGIDLGQLLGGAVITETIFSWPGAGRQLIQAVGNRDYPIVQATVFVTAILVILITALVDIAYRLLDPRVEIA